MKAAFRSTTSRVAPAPPPTLTLAESFVLKNRKGLHARPCALLVKTVRPFDCEMMVEGNGHIANANSILSLMALAAGYETRLIFTATGKDAARALAAVRRLFDTNFEEAYLQRKVVAAKAASVRSQPAVAQAV